MPLCRRRAWKILTTTAVWSAANQFLILSARSVCRGSFITGFQAIQKLNQDEIPRELPRSFAGLHCMQEKKRLSLPLLFHGFFAGVVKESRRAGTGHDGVFVYV